MVRFAYILAALFAFCQSLAAPSGYGSVNLMAPSRIPPEPRSAGGKTAFDEH